MRTYRVSDGMELIADKEKWGGNLTVMQFESDTVKKSTGTHVCKKRLYVSSCLLGRHTRVPLYVVTSQWKACIGVLIPTSCRIR